MFLCNLSSEIQSNITASGQVPSIAFEGGGLQARDIDMNINRAPTFALNGCGLEFTN